MHKRVEWVFLFKDTLFNICWSCLDKTSLTHIFSPQGTSYIAFMLGGNFKRRNQQHKTHKSQKCSMKWTTKRTLVCNRRAEKKKKKEGRASLCPTSAGNAGGGQFRFFVALRVSANDSRGSVNIDFGSQILFEPVGEFAARESAHSEVQLQVRQPLTWFLLRSQTIVVLQCPDRPMKRARWRRGWFQSAAIPQPTSFTSFLPTFGT